VLEPGGKYPAMAEAMASLKVDGAHVAQNE
jgi:hypothetical protein